MRPKYFVLNIPLYGSIWCTDHFVTPLFKIVQGSKGLSEFGALKMMSREVCADEGTKPK